jgi:hypothetical protein
LNFEVGVRVRVRVKCYLKTSNLEKMILVFIIKNLFFTVSEGEHVFESEVDVQIREVEVQNVEVSGR